jgi:hypothetical protein
MSILIASSSIRARKKRIIENAVFRAQVESFLEGTREENGAGRWGGAILSIEDRPTQYEYEKFIFEFSRARFDEAAHILSEYIKHRSPETPKNARRSDGWDMPAKRAGTATTGAAGAGAPAVKDDSRAAFRAELMAIQHVLTDKSLSVADTATKNHLIDLNA